MTTNERKLKRKQKLARDIQRFKRVTGASWTQMSKFSGVYYNAIRDYFDVRREINEEHFKKLQDMFSRKEEFIKFITPPKKYCARCGVELPEGYTATRCLECAEIARKEQAAKARERYRAKHAEKTEEERAKARQTKKDRMMFKGMSENMRKISAIEVEARKRGLDYGKYLPIYNGGRI